MKIIDGKNLISILISGIILINLTGCGKTKEENIENKQNQNESSLTIEKNDSNTLNNSNNSNDNVIDKSFDDTVSDNDLVSETNNSTDIDDSNLTSDEIVLKYFNDATEEINNMMNSENVNNVKSKCREYFIIFVDFIFYDGKIKGCRCLSFCISYSRRHPLSSSTRFLFPAMYSLLLRSCSLCNTGSLPLSRPLYNCCMPILCMCRSFHPQQICLPLISQSFHSLS